MKEKEKRDSLKNIELIINNKKIKICGNKNTIERAKKFIDKLKLDGDEKKDRLKLQKCIDDNNIGADVLYENNIVYSLNKIVKLYKAWQKEESLEKTPRYLYKFFIDIAKDKFDDELFYSNSFRKFEYFCLIKSESELDDINKIFKEIKIGKYYEDRNKINLNNISLPQLKELIERSNWQVIPEGNDWQLKIDLNKDLRFAFILEIGDGKVSDIIYSLCKYCKNFDPNEYAEVIIKESSKELSSMPVRMTIDLADEIKARKMMLAQDLLYRSRVLADEIENNLNTK